MKTYLINFVCFLSMFYVLSQNTANVIKAKYTIRNNISPERLKKTVVNSSGIPREGVDEMLKMFLNAGKDYELFFDTNTFSSFYYTEPDIFSEDGEFPYGMIGLNSPYFITEKGMFSGNILAGNERSLFFKGVPSLDWEITKETKKVGNYTYTKAIPKGDISSTTVVWYTEDIPFPVGPMQYFGLPGMVMEVEIPNYIRIDFKGMENTDKNLTFVKSKIKNVHKKLEKKHRQIISWEEVKAEFKEIIEQTILD